MTINQLITHLRNTTKMAVSTRDQHMVDFAPVGVEVNGQTYLLTGEIRFVESIGIVLSTEDINNANVIDNNTNINEEYDGKPRNR